MPSDHGQLVSTSQQDIATLPLHQAIDAYAPNFAAVLPANVSLDHFKRMVVTAINTNPDLADADRRSLFNACIKCASDGLLPDGREAALVVFNTKIKRKVGTAWHEEWVKLVQFLPMIAGIRKRMRNSGEVISATAEVVCENDEFDYALGDNPFIHHKPAPFSASRGKPVGAYAIIKLKEGEPLRDVMRREEIEAARSKSRAKDSPMWVDFWGEGAKKTVLRRCAKAAPQSAGMESLLARDEELPELPPMTQLAAPAPEPPRGNAIAHQPEQEDQPGPSWLVVDCDGEEHEYYTADEATRALVTVFDDADRRGPTHLAAARENNTAMIAEFGDPHPHSPGAGAEPHESATSSAPGLRSGSAIGRTVGSIPATGANHSPAGESNPAKTHTSGKDASLPEAKQPAPAGDTDLLGGKSQPQRNIYLPLKMPPSDNDLNRWTDHIDRLLDEKVSPVAIHAAHAKEIEGLKQCDPHEYDILMEKLEGR